MGPVKNVVNSNLSACSVTVPRCVRRYNYVWCFALLTVLIFIYFKTQWWTGLVGDHDDDNKEETGSATGERGTGHEVDLTNTVDFFRKHTKKVIDANEKNELEIKRYVGFYNKMGKPWTNLYTFEESLMDMDDRFKTLVRSRSVRSRKILQNQSNTSRTLPPSERNLLRINVATVACSKSTIDVMVMLKSAVMFSRDTHLHVIIFGDKTLPLLAESVLGLKWTVNTLGWDFTYELYSVWFPKDQNEEWKQMYALCATQRLFFASLLPHIDSLIYLDADSIVVSNLTNFWLEFGRMNESQIAGIAPNTEYPANGFYNLWSNVPYYGQRGLNAGILTMNLTRLREFDFENKALATYTLYKDKIQMADQDILNIMFHAYPEKLQVLDCTYNFIWAHCGEPNTGSYERICLNEKAEGPICFCHSSMRDGIRIVHGNMGTFRKPDYPLFQSLYKHMSKFNLSRDSYMELLQKLIDEFNSFDRPCFYLTGEKMYDNAKKYLRNLKLITNVDDSRVVINI